MIKHAWDKVSFRLHLLMAICVVVQIGILFFKWYIPVGSALHAYRSQVFMYHKYIGMFTFVVVLAYFISKLCDQNKIKFLRLFPYSKQGLSDVASDLKTLFRLKLPVRVGGGLAGFIQGLGLLLLLGLAFIGTLAFLCGTLPVGPGLAKYTGTLYGLHKDLGAILWWYLGGHVGMACLHKLLPNKMQEEKS